jgi:hypothetical protein
VHLTEDVANGRGPWNRDLAEWTAMQAPAPLPPEATPTSDSAVAAELTMIVPRELGGPQGPEPTRFGDWEKAGRCIDF